MERIISTALVLISIMVWMVKKYGALPLLTGHIAKHAAVGRAKWTFFWNNPVRDHRQRAYSASDLILLLRAERQQTVYVLAA